MRFGSLKPEDPIRERLQVVACSNPDLRVAARLYESILPLVRDAEFQVAPLPLDREKVTACLERGVSLLSEFELEVESQGLEVLLLKLAGAVESMGAAEKWQQRMKAWLATPDSAEAARQAGFYALKSAAAHIRQAIEDGFLDPARILGLAAGGSRQEVAEIAGCLKLDAELLWTLARNSLKPALYIYRRNVADLAAGLPWNSVNCFVCGSQAILAELQDNEQEKHLRCGQCGADWYVNRLECSYCGNLDHTTQRHLYVDGCDTRRIEACDVCRGYLKVISSFTPIPPEMLAVEDLATLQLDFIARQNGYDRAEHPRAEVE